MQLDKVNNNKKKGTKVSIFLKVTDIPPKYSTIDTHCLGNKELFYYRFKDGWMYASFKNVSNVTAIHYRPTLFPFT